MTKRKTAPKEPPSHNTDGPVGVAKLPEISAEDEEELEPPRKRPAVEGDDKKPRAKMNGGTSAAKAVSFQLELLPPPIIAQVCEYLDLANIWRLSRCNKTLERIITRDCPTLWRQIDFSTLSKHVRRRVLNDGMLANVLSKVNAANLTISLNLNHCYNLKGTGLHPLQRSTVLERVSLLCRPDHNEYSQKMRRGDSRWNVDAIRQILAEPMANNLMDINLSIASLWPSARWDGRSFLRDIRRSNVRQAAKGNEKCKHCQEAIVQVPANSAENEINAPSSRCLECHSFVCHRDSCPHPLRDCNGCGRSICEDCQVLKQCKRCEEYFCSQCKFVKECFDCSETFCRDCKPLRKCTQCNEHFCIGDTRACAACSETSCLWLGCSRRLNLTACKWCEREICKYCDNIKPCEVCSTPFCTECVEEHKCVEYL